MQQLVVVHGQDVAVIDVDVTFLSATCGTRRAVRTRPSQVAPLYPLTHRQGACQCVPPYWVIDVRLPHTSRHSPIVEGASGTLQHDGLDAHRCLLQPRDRFA